MDAVTTITIIAIVAAVVVAAMVARRTPKGSGGAPGEVVGDRPLTEETGASLGDSARDGGPRHAGPAEDRPGGPGQEAMDPGFTAAEGQPADSAGTPGGDEGAEHDREGAPYDRR